MTLSLKFEHPHFPEGQEFAVNFLGSVKNGETLELDEDAERMFVAVRGITVEDAFKDDALVSVSGSSALSQDETSQLIEAVNPAPPVTENEGEDTVSYEEFVEGGGTNV